MDHTEHNTIIDYFESQVMLNCDEIAVQDKNSSITYGEFNTKINKLSHVLIKKGIKNNCIVMVIMDRSIDMLATIFAIMKAGGCYLPVKTDTPIKRISALIEDSCPELIITDKNCNALSFQNIDAININQLETDNERDTNPKIKINREDIAYIIYTSGSTGIPKGVLINHGALLNRILWMDKQYHLKQDDVIYQKTIYTFDVSVWELLLWSISGGKVFLLEPKKEYDVGQFCTDIMNHNITIIHMVPSVLELFLEYVQVKKNQEQLKSLRLVFSSGEKLSAETVNKFYSLFTSEKIHLENLYGPTETTIDVTCFSCKRNINYNDIPIGKPIDKVETEIFYHEKGNVGELIVSGICLSRGYLNRVELTHDKFQTISSKRSYFTGDLCSYDKNNNIIYHGRNDSQVKIHGIRIELGEIEKCILKHPSVKKCAVLLKENQWKNQYICAYLMLENNQQLIDIKKYIEESLPKYMIPTMYRVFDNFPLNSNGKLDKNVLSKL